MKVELAQESIQLPPETAGADLHGKVLNNRDLRCLDFYEANFYGAEMRGTLLSQADLSYALLVHADLQDADLRGTKLVLADLRNAKLNGAKLKRASFFPDIENLTETSVRLHLDHYLYQYKRDENYDVLRAAILDDLVNKTQEMLDKGCRDKALGCLYVAKDHPFFNRNYHASPLLFSSNGSCQEIEKLMEPILGAQTKQHQIR